MCIDSTRKYADKYMGFPLIPFLHSDQIIPFLYLDKTSDIETSFTYIMFIICGYRFASTLSIWNYLTFFLQMQCCSFITATIHIKHY